MYTIVCRRIHDTQVRRGGRSVWFLERDVSLLVCAALSDCRDLDSLLKLKFHGSSFLRSILMTSSPGCPQQVVRVVLVNFGKRHRHTDKRAALHCNRPPADQSGKRVASWTGKSPDTPDLLRTFSRWCHEDATLKTVQWRSETCWMTLLMQRVVNAQEWLGTCWWATDMQSLRWSGYILPWKT